MKKEPTSTPAKHAKLSYRNGARLLPGRSVTVVHSVVARKSRSDLTLAVSSCSTTLSPGCSANSRRLSSPLHALTVPGVTRQLGAGALSRSLQLLAKYTTPLSWMASTLAHWSASLPEQPTMSSLGIGLVGSRATRGVSCWLPYRRRTSWSVTARKVSCWLLPGAGLKQAFSVACFTSGSMCGAS